METTSQRALVFGFLAFLTAFLTAFLFWATGFSANDFFSLSVSSKIAKVMTVNFALFLLVVPLTGALAGTASFWLDKKTVWISMGIGSALGLGLAALLFSSLLDFFWVGVFLSAGFFFPSSKYT